MTRNARHVRNHYIVWRHNRDVMKPSTNHNQPITRKCAVIWKLWVKWRHSAKPQHTLWLIIISHVKFALVSHDLWHQPPLVAQAPEPSWAKPPQHHHHHPSSPPLSATYDLASIKWKHGALTWRPLSPTPIFLSTRPKPPPCFSNFCCWKRSRTSLNHIQQIPFGLWKMRE